MIGMGENDECNEFHLIFIIRELGEDLLKGSMCFCEGEDCRERKVNKRALRGLRKKAS